MFKLKNMKFKVVTLFLSFLMISYILYLNFEGYDILKGQVGMALWFLLPNFIFFFSKKSIWSDLSIISLAILIPQWLVFYDYVYGDDPSKITGFILSPIVTASALMGFRALQYFFPKSR